MVIQHNISALNSYRNLKTNKSKFSKNLERLSSGYKINRAGDDAAGLAISESMRSLINGTKQAENNTQDGIALIHTAEGAMQEIHSMLQRAYKLSIASANGTYNDQERQCMQEEIDELKLEIDRIATDTDFNDIKVLKGKNTPGMYTLVGGTTTSTLPAWMLESGTTTTTSGYLSGTYDTEETYSNGTSYTIHHGSATLDFSKANSGNINDLVGSSFYSTCFTCTQYFRVNFANDGLGHRKSVNGEDHIYTIDIKGITTAEDLVKAIIKGSDDGNPNGHFLKLAASTDGKKLIIYDDRSKDPSPVGSNSPNGWKDWQFPDFNVNLTNNPKGARFGHSVTVGGTLVPLPASDIHLQVGPSASEIMEIDLPNIDMWDLGFNEVRVDTQERASISADTLKLGMNFLSQERGRMGAYENRLEHAFNALTTSEENLTAAESRIRDTDMAKEITAFTKNNILLQAAQSMMAQANATTQGVLGLIQG